MATVDEVRAALELLGLDSLPVPPRPNSPAILNVWVGEGLHPSTSLVAPQPERPGFDNWAWGHSYEHTMPGDADAAMVARRVAASLVPLVWEDADTDEPGDQNASSVLPHSFWSLGPTHDGRWSVELIVRNAELDEIPGAGVHLGNFATEDAAKAAAERHERGQ